MTNQSDANLQKLAIEVADHFRTYYTKGIVPILLTLDNQKWAGMLYPVDKDYFRLYCVGQLEEKRLYHLPDSPLEWYASNTVRDNITPDRKIYHPWGPSFQLFALTMPTTESQRARYEHDHPDRVKRVPLGMQRYISKFARWETIKPTPGLKRAWPYQAQEVEPSYPWIALSHPAYPQDLYVQAHEHELADVIRQLDPTLTGWTVKDRYCSFPPGRRGERVHLVELASWLSRKQWGKLTAALQRPGTTGLVLYLNRELSSARGPEPAVYPFGPDWTMKDQASIVERVGDMPSNFKYRESFCLKTATGL